jgi:hypothetical protein
MEMFFGKDQLSDVEEEIKAQQAAGDLRPEREGEGSCRRETLPPPSSAQVIFGSEIAKKFAAEGFTIFAGRRRGNKLAPVAEFIEKAGGTSIPSVLVTLMPSASGFSGTEGPRAASSGSISAFARFAAIRAMNSSSPA